MATSTDVSNLISAYTGWVNAFNSWVKDDANSSQGLIAASESLSLSFTPFISGNSLFAAAANDIGVPVALNAFKLDVQAFNLSTLKQDQRGEISAALSLVSDIGGATAGVAVIAAATQLGANEPLDTAAAVSASISALAAGAKFGYDAGVTINTLLENIDSNSLFSGFLGDFDNNTGQNISSVVANIQNFIEISDQAADNGETVTLKSNNLILSSTITNKVTGASTTLSVSSAAPTVKIIATFTGTSGTTPGGSPEGGLIEDSTGNLYGTTAGGGAQNDGTAFEIPKTATGYGALTSLVSFNTSSANSGPPGGLIDDSAGDLFGTTSGGGVNYAGSVFEIAKGATTSTTLASFNFGGTSVTTGEGPNAGLIIDSAGDLFGTTIYGGTYRDGAVFELPKTIGGYGPLQLLASFNFNVNGAGPRAGLILDSAGNLVGTTSQGGAFSDGTVFKIAKAGGTPITLFNFNGTDGSSPLSGLITDGAGDLFGTTFEGGPSGKGAGTVFEIKKTSNGYATAPTTLVDFYTSSAGYEPVGGVIMDAAGNLFGTTSMGGPNGAGTVFEIKTANTATGYASTPIIVNDNFNFSGYGGILLADKTTGNLFIPSGGGVGYGTEVEITNSGFVTAAPTAKAAAATAAPTTVAAGSTLDVTSTKGIANLVDDGTVAIASGGSLDVSSAVDPSSTGVFQLTSKALLEIAALPGSEAKIQFLGTAPANDLIIDSASIFGTKVGSASYAGPLLESFTAGDIIDLKGIANSSLKLAYTAATGDLQITGSSGNALATLAFQNSTLGAGTFYTASDGVGGTLIMRS